MAGPSVARSATRIPQRGQETPLFPNKGVHQRRSEWPGTADATPWQIVGGSPSEMLEDADLNGGWYVQLAPKDGSLDDALRGALRIHRAQGTAEQKFGPFLISCDLYSRGNGTVAWPDPIAEFRMEVDDNWYPQLPWADYTAHFKSRRDQSVTYAQGKLSFDLEYFMWDRNWYPNAGAPVPGSCSIDCPLQIVTHSLLPQPTLHLTGTATIDGRVYSLVAIKTSPFFRGCHVEVDVMTGRAWVPEAQLHDGSLRTFAGVFRETGIDIDLSISETDIPSDPELTDAQLLELFENHRDHGSDARSWRLWMVIASSLDEKPDESPQGQTPEPWFGAVVEKPITSTAWRDCIAVFYDPSILVDDDFGRSIEPGLEGKRLGDVDRAFLRTALHEAGHAFSLIHPVDDFWLFKKRGRTIMNRTGDVKKEADDAQPFPQNIEFRFEPENELLLIHSPDPKFAPGWTRGARSATTWPEFRLRNA